MIEGLKACPFCGGGARYIESGYVIKCTGCGAESCIQSREIDCIAAWNRRTPAPMTSVVTWVRYKDEKPPSDIELLHSEWSHVNKKYGRVMRIADADTCSWRDNDVWAYWPTPPEADA